MKSGKKAAPSRKAGARGAGTRGKSSTSKQKRAAAAPARRAASKGSAGAKAARASSAAPARTARARTAAAPARSKAARAPAPARSKAARAPARRAARAPASVNPGLFEPLTEGERADALRILTEDRRLATMAKVARYRVVAVEPLVLKPRHELFGRRLVRVVAFDYAAGRSVEVLIDLDEGVIAHLQFTQSQPALSRGEESAAVAVALADERVKRELGLGDEPQAAMHYWSRREGDMAAARRSAAVLFGQPGCRPSLVAVVDLVDGQVSDVVAGSQW